jgi:hypothetical protein
MLQLEPPFSLKTSERQSPGKHPIPEDNTKEA